jgi:hypothetical protein
MDITVVQVAVLQMALIQAELLVLVLVRVLDMQMPVVWELMLTQEGEGVVQVQ